MAGLLSVYLKALPSDLAAVGMALWKPLATVWCMISLAGVWSLV